MSTESSAPEPGDATSDVDDGLYQLRLLITGTTPLSSRAIVNIRRLCEEHLAGRYQLEVVDIARNPAAATQNQVVAAPTLIKSLPLPVRRFIGDMSRTDRLLLGLGLVDDVLDDPP